MDAALLSSRHDYYRALNEIADLMTARWNTPEGERLDTLVALVEEWEQKNESVAAFGAE